MTKPSPGVTALVVTFNRREMLAECLAALRSQTPRPDVLVVDNASADGTAAMVRQSFPDVELTTLPHNAGGAGGFHEGLSILRERRGIDYVWLMDDDTVVGEGSLGALLDAAAELAGEAEVSFLASRVLWTDGRDHPMNLPPVDRDTRRALVAAEHGAVAVQSASFVSLLVPTSVVRSAALPMRDYFIWKDDVEYTTRLAQAGLGVMVPGSRVTHKTARGEGADRFPGPRYFFHVRNTIWMIRWSPAFRGRRLRTACLESLNVARLVRSTSPRATLVRVLLTGLLAGVCRRPRA